MKIMMDNVNFNSSSGPNHFGTKLAKYLKTRGHEITDVNPHVQLSFIETWQQKIVHPLVQRLDGIYFNTDFDFGRQNSNIYRTYREADGVVFQANFAKELVFKYFGKKDNHIIIPNGADLEEIERTPTDSSHQYDKYDDIWMCASSWRPHKRLDENIRYFLEHSTPNSALIVAGEVEKKTDHPRIYYVGNLKISKLYSLYKRASTFVHLAWLDYCPNVVVDARAAGCKIICSSTGGTREVAGQDAVVLREEDWDFAPTRLYSPPPINFDNIDTNLNFKTTSDMIDVTERYETFLKTTIDTRRRQ